MPHSEFIVYLIVVAVGVMMAASVHRRRQAIAIKLKRLALYGGTYCVSAFICTQIHLTQLETVTISILAGIVIGSTVRSRKRRIPAREKRRAIARYELSGQKYDSRKHELDHVVPFSKGGNHTADNLRVIERAANRSKGNKSPWWDLLGNLTRN